MQKDQSKMQKTTTLQRAMFFFGTVISAALTWTTLTGELQQHIHFAGIANEMAFAIFGSMLSGIFFYLTISE